MIYNLYSVFDSKANKYNAPFLSPNDEVAKRNFSGMLNHDVMMKDFKADFKLYQIGKFDDDKSDLVDLVPVLVDSGSEYDII